jgi:hypothetical protein
MTDRRSFLKGILTLGVISAVPMSRLIVPVPTIWGDGIHDDAPGLNALLRGDRFIVEADGVIAEDGVIQGGTFLIRAPLVINRFDVFLTKCRFTAAPDFQGEFLLDARGTGVGEVSHCHFIAPSRGVKYGILAMDAVVT